MSQEYRKVIQDFLGGWSEDQDEEIRHKARLKLASSIGGFDTVYDKEDYEDLLNGEETVTTQQMKRVYEENEFADLKPDRILRKAEKEYAAEKAEEGIDNTDVDFRFNVPERTVGIKVPESKYLDVLEKFRDYEGQVSLNLSKTVSVDLASEEEMLEAAESEGDWEIEGVMPQINFEGGEIGYEFDTDYLLVGIEEYTEEVDEVLDQLGL